MQFNVEKTIPKIKKMEARAVGGLLDYEDRWKLFESMKQVDKDINFYSLRPLTGELLNFIDGKRTIKEIADAVGYEYGVKIEGKDFLTFLLPLKENGILTFEIK